MDMKRCTHCGETKPQTEFRKYYNRPGLYSACIKCTNLEQTYSRLKRTGRSVEQQATFEKLEELFEYRRKAGLITPGIKERRQEYQQEQLIKSIQEAKQRP